MRISGSNAGYTVFGGSVKSTGYPLHSPVSPSLPLPRVTVCHHVSNALYCTRRYPSLEESVVLPLRRMRCHLSHISHCRLLPDPHPLNIHDILIPVNATRQVTSAAETLQLNTASLFYRSCQGMHRRMQACLAVNVPCSVRR